MNLERWSNQHGKLSRRMRILFSCLVKFLCFSRWVFYFGRETPPRFAESAHFDCPNGISASNGESRELGNRNGNRNRKNWGIEMGISYLFESNIKQIPSNPDSIVDSLYKFPIISQDFLIDFQWTRFSAWCWWPWSAPVWRIACCGSASELHSWMDGGRRRRRRGELLEVDGVLGSSNRSI